ncbi:ras GTPase-activating protein, putative [Entamoeba invadens IP1]|uniref:ras GTPase-activating protein, putative n=1 Tax=Entamoeba invadens IP1 TaxID=370355 RepID=UPI0002C3EDC5|nr:ras GTPase-activating protein, putative [Entamoeba invadens IP1]ELP94212.1 ras GTPase-activating protein, putative [Entamoeba invadens IP1]|eukprot:XP_004260983.1 ras GTPase-activating protein, putative [Entamoeba invadens IP1]
MATNKIIINKSDFVDIYPHYVDMVSSLTSNIDLCIYIGKTLPPELQDPYTKLITNVLDKYDKIVPFINAMIDDEYDSAITEGTLFRSNNLCSRVMTHYAKTTCKTFLRQSLKNVITEINTINCLFELDTTKNPNLTQKQVENNTQLLLDYCTKTIRSVEQQLYHLPIQIISICQTLFQKSKEKFPANPILPHSIVSGFLFLRVICPALTTPEASVFDTEVPVTPTCRRNLILITKVIQNIANNVTTPKEPYIAPTMDYTIEMSKRVNSDIENLCNQHDAEFNLGRVSFQIQDVVEVNTLFELHVLINKANALQKKPQLEKKERERAVPKITQRAPRHTFVNFVKTKEDDDVKVVLTKPVARVTSAHKFVGSEGTVISIDVSEDKSRGEVQSNSAENVLGKVATENARSVSPSRSVGWTKGITRSKSPQLNMLRTKKAKKRVKKSDLELFLDLSQISRELGMSPYIKERKIGIKTKVEVDKDETKSFVQTVVDELKTEEVLYIDKAQDGAKVVYVIMNKFVSILEEDDVVKTCFDEHWGEMCRCVFDGLGKYDVLFDMSGVNYDLNKIVLKCIKNKDKIFSDVERKNVRRVIVFHPNKRVRKFISTAKDFFPGKSLKKLFVAETCVDLENVVGVNCVNLPETSLAMDRREFTVTKVNKKGKLQTRVLRLTLGELCNIDPMTRRIINTIDLLALERIDITEKENKMEIIYKQKGVMDNREYHFKNSALIEKVIYELFNIFWTRKGREGKFSFIAKKAVVETNTGMLSLTKGFLKTECQIYLTINSILIIDLVSVRDIDLSSVIEVKHDTTDNKIKVSWKDVGREAESWSVEYFEGCEHFVRTVNELVVSIKRKL